MFNCGEPKRLVSKAEWRDVVSCVIREHLDVVFVQNMVDCKSFQICLSPKEILLWRQPAISLACYLVLYYFIGLLEQQSFLTTCSLLVLTVLVAEFILKEVCLRLFGRQLTYTNYLSTPMSPLSACILELWAGAGQLLGSLRQPVVAMLAVVCGSVLVVLSTYMDTISLLSTLLSIVMVGPALYYGSRYSHLAQAVAQFSLSICQPGLLDDDEEDEDGAPCGNLDAKVEEDKGTYRDIFKEEEPEPKQQPAPLPPTSTLDEAPANRHGSRKSSEDDSSSSPQVSPSSRRSSSASVDLEDYDVISTQELASHQL